MVGSEKGADADPEGLGIFMTRPVTERYWAF